jgi:RNA polymerase sigma-70 factor (ECF subfamily)
MNQEKAFLEAFDAYADALYRHGYFRVSDAERAQDLVADTYTRAWDYLVKGNTIQEWRPFLYRTLNRLIIDEYRKKKSESLDALLDDQDVPEGAFEELVHGSLKDLEMSLDAQRVPELIQAMPDTYREVIVLRYIDGMQPKEIAVLLNESVNVVSVRIHRGMSWLQQRAIDLGL